MKLVHEIGGKEYPVIGGSKAVHPTTGEVITVPLVDIPMMSDERWNELAAENAIHNYTREMGVAPKSTEEAVEWQKEWIDQRLTEQDKQGAEKVNKKIWKGVQISEVITSEGIKKAQSNTDQSE